MAIEGAPDESDRYDIELLPPHASYYESVDTRLVRTAAAYVEGMVGDESEAELAEREARFDRAETLALAVGTRPEADLTERADRVDTFLRRVSAARKEAERLDESPAEARARVEAAGTGTLLDPENPNDAWLDPDEVPTVSVGLVMVRDAIQDGDVASREEFDAELRERIDAAREAGR